MSQVDPVDHLHHTARCGEGLLKLVNLITPEVAIFN